MTTPLIQAIDERIKQLHCGSQDCEGTQRRGMLIRELEQIKQLAIAEETRIVKAFIDSCIVQEGNPPPIFRFPRDAIKIVKNEK